MCYFTMNPHVSLFVGLLVGRLVSVSYIITSKRQSSSTSILLSEFFFSHRALRKNHFPVEKNVDGKERKTLKKMAQQELDFRT